MTDYDDLRFGADESEYALLRRQRLERLATALKYVA